MRVTVITPVYNGVETISECIQSVKAQSYKNIRHIVIDANSTDGTNEIVKSFGVECFSEADFGIYHAFNKGVSKVKSGLVHILNADDYYASTTVVEDVVEVFKEKKCELFHGLISQIDCNGEELKVVGGDYDKKALLRKMRVAHPSVFVKSEVYKKLGDFGVGFKVAGDHEFLLRAWSTVNVLFEPILVTKMRMGGASNSQIELSYKESLAAALLHGQSPLRGFINYYYEILKAKLGGLVI